MGIFYPLTYTMGTSIDVPVPDIEITQIPL